MTYNLFNTFMVMIVLDLGSSLFKVIYTGEEGHPQALAIGPQLVSGVKPQQTAARMEEYGADPLRSAWVDFAGESYAAGEFALDLAGRQYHELSKWHDLLPRVLTVLGLIADRLDRCEGFQAQVALLMPRDEVNSLDREAHKEKIVQAARHFHFRGQPVAWELDLKFSTEGAGLFAAHAVALERQGINPARVDIPVLMGGERNTSLILYRGGKINPSFSSSDGPGFFQFADQLKKSVGLPVALPEVIQAIAQKRYRFRSSGNEMADISDLAPGVLKDYLNAVQGYFKAKLPQTDMNIIAGGGAFSLIWDQLDLWFQDLEIPATYIGSPLIEEATQLLSQLGLNFDLASYSALSARFADALGIYKMMIARHQQKPVQKNAKVR